LLSCDKLFPHTKWLASVDEISLGPQNSSAIAVKRLHHQLFKGKLTKHDAVELWLYYMIFPFVDMLAAFVLCLGTQLYDIAKNYLLDMLPRSTYTVIYRCFGLRVRVFIWHFAIETVADPIYAISMVEYNAGDRRLGTLAGIASLHLGWKLVGAFLVAVYMLYGAMVAYLIWLGMNRKRMKVL
jgi:hypothetical protein